MCEYQLTIPSNTKFAFHKAISDFQPPGKIIPTHVDPILRAAPFLTFLQAADQAATRQKILISSSAGLVCTSIRGNRTPLLVGAS